MRKTDGFAFSHAVQVWERAAWDVEAAVGFCVLPCQSDEDSIQLCPLTFYRCARDVLPLTALLNFLFFV